MEKNTSLVVSSPNIKYTDDYIYSDYVYEETLVTKNGNEFLVCINIFLFNYPVFLCPVRVIDTKDNQ